MRSHTPRSVRTASITAGTLATKRISARRGDEREAGGEERGWIGQLHRRTDVALGYGLRPREAAVVRGMVLGTARSCPSNWRKHFSAPG